jgi:PKD repeat protein
MAPASIDSGSYDPDGGPITLTQTPPGPYPVGATTVTLTVENTAGCRDSCTATVTVREVTPPHISVELNKYVLWPPNHKMVDITATVRVTDDCCARPTFMLVSITSNEPDNGKGDGNTIGDIKEATFGRPDVAFQLRAERSGKGNGRIYTIVYAAEDCSGNAAYDTVQVRVPHDGSLEVQDEQLPGTPRITALLPSYPNPFNPTTRIPFDLATKEQVSLQIFDTQGRLVRTLCDEVMPEGTHEALWDGRDNSGSQVAAGIYFVRFTAGNYQLTKKLVMVR